MFKPLLTALFPLVLFWAIEEFLGLKAALIAGCAAAIIEVIWEYTTTKHVSFITWASNSLVLGLGAISFVMNSGVAFKLQPAVMELGMGFMMLGLRIQGDPFMLRTFKDFSPRKMPGLTEEKHRFLIEQPWFIKKISGMDTRLIFFFLVHGLAVVWAAVWGTTREWILLKGVLFYVLLVLVMLPMYKRPEIVNHKTNPEV